MKYSSTDNDEVSLMISEKLLHSLEALGGMLGGTFSDEPIPDSAYPVNQVPGIMVSCGIYGTSGGAWSAVIANFCAVIFNSYTSALLLEF